MFSVGWPRLLSRVLHQWRGFLGSEVSLGSQCGCHLRLFIECVCVCSTKNSTMPAYCMAANCNNSQATQSITMHEFPRNRPAVRRKWVKFVQFKRADFYAAPQSRPFVYWALRLVRFRNWTLWRNTKWGLLQSWICRAVHRVTDLQKNPVRISKDEADEQQAHSMIPNTERYTDALKQALTRQRQKV